MDEARWSAMQYFVVEPDAEYDGVRYMHLPVAGPFVTLEEARVARAGRADAVLLELRGERHLID